MATTAPLLIGPPKASCHACDQRRVRRTATSVTGQPPHAGCTGQARESARHQWADSPLALDRRQSPVIPRQDQRTMMPGTSSGIPISTSCLVSHRVRDTSRDARLMLVGRAMPYGASTFERHDCLGRRGCAAGSSASARRSPIAVCRATGPRRSSGPGKPDTADFRNLGVLGVPSLWTQRPMDAGPMAPFPSSLRPLATGPSHPAHRQRAGWTGPRSAAQT